MFRQPYFEATQQPDYDRALARPGAGKLGRWRMIESRNEHE
jgi:hypothetical protein